MHLRGPQKSNTHSMPLLLNSRIISYSWTAHNSYWERQFKANSKLEFSSLSLATFLNNSVFIMCLIQVLLCLLRTTCLLEIAIYIFKCKKKINCCIHYAGRIGRREEETCKDSYEPLFWYVFLWELLDLSSKFLPEKRMECTKNPNWCNLLKYFVQQEWAKLKKLN